ncbi:MAG TPA: 3-dehydro-L-gulonate 2-dehydrogenase [Terriglobales bacterium]|nr:3-dehydro-L-gulonate 2-dehydrogenase [Terriglobales bacterium]
MSVASETRVSYDELQSTLAAILRELGFSDDRAQLSARLFADASRDGVASHGLNRFPRFVRGIRSGLVDPRAVPILVSRFGALERWDGQRGPGNLNAYSAMQRAIELGREHGVGCVGLGNTNHWMRGGNYGWQAADAGLIGICWTNTMPNLPPWGSSDPRLGNNPIIISVPRKTGHVVLDMAMSQFSYGAIESYRLKQQLLPVPGGFNIEGELTRDPAEIEHSQRALPAGYWKGSGMALMLDMIATMLAGGSATHQIPADSERETALSQVFITIDPSKVGGAQQIADEIIDDLHGATSSGEATVRYPGEQVLKIRSENMECGIPVNAAIWEEVRGYKQNRRR